jgi:hypothetical protein
MNIVGKYSVYDVDAAGKWHFRFSKSNLLMVSWGMAAARSLGFGDVAYKIDKVYVEFENVTLPGDAVTIPSFTKFDGRDYYDGLTSPQDYLRLTTDGDPTLQIASGYEDYFTEGTDGNSLHFRAQTSGTAGINGVAFNDSANSKAFGLALVASPVEGDRTQDIVVTRGYWDVADQVLKQASGQIGVTWDLTFKPDS